MSAISAPEKVDAQTGQRPFTRPSKPPIGKLTYEEFLAWADEDTLAEWVHGEIRMTSPASDQHQTIAGFLGNILSPFVEEHNLGVVRVAPFQMKLEHGREPDLLFVSNEHRGRLLKTHLEGPADLAVEILSPESQNRDRGDKFYEYEQAGIPEYWLIDPMRQWAEFYNLDEREHYRPTCAGSEGVFQSKAVPGFWLRVEWLWQPPRVLQVLRELQLV